MSDVIWPSSLMSFSLFTYIFICSCMASYIGRSFSRIKSHLHDSDYSTRCLRSIGYAGTLIFCVFAVDALTSCQKIDIGPTATELIRWSLTISAQNSYWDRHDGINVSTEGKLCQGNFRWLYLSWRPFEKRCGSGMDFLLSYDRFAISVTRVVIYFETSSCERLTCR